MEWNRRDCFYQPRQQTEFYNSRLGRMRDSSEIESSNWRASLHTVFISNIDRKMSSIEIWTMFNAYRVVVDVFLPKHTSNRYTRFAFVRYRYREEQRKALLAGNNKIVAGCRIKVGYAIERKLDRKKEKIRYSGHRNTRTSGSSRDANRKRKTHRVQVSWEQMRHHGDDKIQARANKADLNHKTEEDKRKGAVASQALPQNQSEMASEDTETTDSIGRVGVHASEEVNLSVHIPEEDLDWLFKSTIAQLGEEKDIQRIQHKLSEGGLNVEARRINGQRILLTFETKADMKSSVKFPPRSAEKWIPYSHTLANGRGGIQFNSLG